MAMERNAYSEMKPLLKASIVVDEFCMKKNFAQTTFNHLNGN